MSELLTLQPVPAALLERVALPEDLTEQMRYAPELGFCAIVAAEGIRIAGFHAGPEGQEELIPAIMLEQRAPESRGLNDNAKGVGVILGNSLESITRPSDLGRARELGLWLTPPIIEGHIADVSHGDSQKLTVIARGMVRQVGLIMIDKTQGTEKAVHQIEKRYDGAHFAILDPAPTWLWKQRKTPHPIVPKWGIWRDTERRPLRRIATIT